jgi:hypothetical protein
MYAGVGFGLRKPVVRSSCRPFVLSSFRLFVFSSSQRCKDRIKAAHINVRDVYTRAHFYFTTRYVAHTQRRVPARLCEC